MGHSVIYLCIVVVMPIRIRIMGNLPDPHGVCGPGKVKSKEKIMFFFIKDLCYKINLFCFFTVSMILSTRRLCGRQAWFIQNLTFGRLMHSALFKFLGHLRGC